MTYKKWWVVVIFAVVLILASITRAAPTEDSGKSKSSIDNVCFSLGRIVRGAWDFLNGLDPSTCVSGRCCMIPKTTSATTTYPTSTSTTADPVPTSTTTDPVPTSTTTDPVTTSTTTDPVTTSTSGYRTLTPEPTHPLRPMAYSVGYVISWTDKFKCMNVEPEQIDALAYTHLHFSFAVVDENGRLGLAKEEEGDYLKRLIEHVKSNFQWVKVVISVGGWSFNDPGPTQSRFTDMVDTEHNRTVFIDSCLDFLAKYGADGIDFDWEYPTAPDRGGRPDDADNLVLLLREMRNAFPSYYSISAAVPVGFSTNYGGFKVAEMATYLDYVTSMTYDMHGTWEYVPGKGGSMGAHTDVRDIRRGIEATINSGVPKEKLLLGLAFYGRSFKQLDPNQSDIGSPFVDPKIAKADPGICTDEVGFMSYGEISAIIEGSTEPIRVHRYDPESLANILAYGIDQWVAYDDAKTITEKVEIAQSLGLGGTSVWAVSYDNEERQLSNAIHAARSWCN